MCDVKKKSKTFWVAFYAEKSYKQSLIGYLLDTFALHDLRARMTHATRAQITSRMLCKTHVGSDHPHSLLDEMMHSFTAQPCGWRSVILSALDVCHVN